MEKEIPLAQIIFPKFDLRYYRSKEFLKYLCADISKEGMLIPPLVTQIDDMHYQIIDGQNRLRCAQKLKWETVKCQVVTIESDTDKVILGLKTNTMRKTHDIMGVINVFSYLKEKGMKQKDIAKRFNMSKGYVSQLLKINNLPTRQKLELAKGKLTLTQAYLMVRQRRNPDLMEKLSIEYRCEACRSKVSFRERELIALCSECRSKLDKVLRQESEKLEHEREQTELKV